VVADGFKTCTKCSARKPIADFYRQTNNLDGHMGKCKECTKQDVKERYRSCPEKIAEYERRRAQDPDRRARVLDYQRTRRARHPEKNRARQMVLYAVRSGRLVPQPCEVCGSARTQAHHDDYSRPLDVRWLCFQHHREHHGQRVNLIESAT
jgi:hypothetical protein